MGGFQIPDNIHPFVDGEPAAGAAENDQGARAQSWINAAKAGGNVPHESAAPAETIDEENAKGNSPTVITPVPHTGIRGFIDKSLDALAGTYGVKLAHDNEGQLYLQHPMLTRGQQWLKIGVEALEGAGAGLKAGKGAGNRGGAAVAGVQTGQQISQDEEEREKDYRLQVANSQALAHTHAAQQLQMTREGIKFDRDTSDYYEGKYNAALSIPGAQDLGKVTNPSELATLMHQNPDAIQQQVKNGDIRVMPSYTPEGKADGFHAVLMPARWGEEQMPAGTKFNIAVPDDDKPGYFKRKEVETSGNISRRQLEAYNDAADTKINEAALAQHKIETEEKQKQALAAQEQANADLGPTRKKELESATNQHNAAAEADRARAASLKAGKTLPDGTLNPAFTAMVDAVYSGDLLTKDMKRQAKGMGLDPNEIMAGAIQKGQAEGRPWSESIIEQENKYASDDKVQSAINGIDRLIGPGGYGDQLMTTAKAAGLGPVGAVNSLTLATRRGYGDTNAKNLETAIGEARRSVAGLIGNPLVGGSGETDQKLKQAEQLLGKAPTIENLQGAWNLIKQALQTQRTSIMQNNRFLQRRFGATPGGTAAPAAPTPAAPKQAGPAPAAPTYQAYSSDGKWGYDGKNWVELKPQVATK